jgi:intracellular multiplication protein IcmP|tara:strand:+ start:2751 stop:3965 length:1215 start_codon:yes stop_codon:yes gene_type:complete
VSEQAGSYERAIGFFILAIVLGVIGYILYNYFEYDIKNVIRYWRIGEIHLGILLHGRDYTILWQMPGTTEVQEWPLGSILDQLKVLDKTLLNDQIMDLAAHAALVPIKYALSAILVMFAIWSMFYGPYTQFRTKFSLNTLIKRQSKIFPYITPFIEFDPGTQPARPPGAPVPAELPLFAEALGPEEFVAYHSLHGKDGDLNYDVSYKAFVKQLGKPWRGALKLKTHEQLLLAAFCLKAARKRKESDELLGKIAKCWSHKKGLVVDKKILKQARSIIRNRDLSGKTLGKCNQHGFVTTAMIRALQTAREEGGVLSSSQFVWLRGFDRNLWYALNNLGRQAFHMEALGSMSHYKVEKRIGRPIPRPKVEEAIQMLTEYMKSDRARPVPNLDYSGSKRRSIKKAKAQ